MAMNVELREKQRVFEVWVGDNSIGEVKSYVDDFDEDDDDSRYEAFLYKTGGTDGEDLELGWYNTLRVAAQQVVEYAHGPCKIDAIKKRKV